MKRLIVFVLACALSAWAQGRPAGAGAGRPSGVGGGSSSGMGSGNASGMSHGSDMGHSDMGSSHRPADTGKQSPDHALSTNTKLSSKLDSLLPAGMTAQQACSGFKNLGQCVAAIHVSKNLGVSFGDLKSKMTGSTSESLGKAIHDLKPDANAKAEEKKAKQQADDDLKTS
jgi:hypothetical protein